MPPLVLALVFWQIPFWFPHGRYLSAAWSAFATAAWSILLACLGVVALLPGPMAGNGAALNYPIANPLSVTAFSHYAASLWAPRLLTGALLFVSLVANLSLVLRWRQAQGDERQQIKLFAFFGAYIVSLFLAVQLIGQFVDQSLVRSPLYIVSFYLAWIGIPLVIGLSVLKYRLYDMDIVIRRTLAYTALSISLALIYLASVTILQLAFAGLSGQRSQVAIVISTLLIAWLFSPLRRSLQHTIDRRFYRSKYDAARTLETFSATIRDEVELKQLLAYLQDVVEDTLQPDMVSVWLTPASNRSMVQGKPS